MEMQAVPTDVLNITDQLSIFYCNTENIFDIGDISREVVDIGEQDRLVGNP